MARHVDTTPDFFADVPRETDRPHLNAALEAWRLWRYQHAGRRNHPLYRSMIEHLKAHTRGEGK